MGDFDEIITTFPSPLRQTGKTKHNRTKQQQTNKNQTKLKHKDVLRAFIWKGLTESSPQPALAPGRLG